MKQIADRGPHIPAQKTLETGAETSASSVNNPAPKVFRGNTISAVCLPLLSESKQIIWVKFCEIDLQMKGVAELTKAFDRFPYLTRQQLTTLAQRCSLHPVEVKTWFMARRLQYGISWEYQDILDVWRDFKPPQKKAQGKKKKENVKEDRGKMKRKVKVSGGGKTVNVKKEQSAKGGGMIEGTVRADEMLPEQPMRKVEDDKSNKLKKRKRVSVTGESGKKKIKQDSEGMTEGAGKMEAKTDEVKSEGQKCTEPPCNIKTPSQLAMMKMAFADCQYPNREHYDRLAGQIGVSRNTLVQWFGDMRYYLKKGRPRWMNQEKYNQALATIKYRQYISALAKMETSEGLKALVESSEGSDAKNEAAEEK